MTQPITSLHQLYKHQYFGKDISIEQATLTELDDFVAIVEDCSSWLAEKGMHHWKNYYTREVLHEKLMSSTSKTYLLYDKHIPIATISLDTQAPAYYIDNDAGENYLELFSNPQASALYIMTLGVRPPYQGRNYAKALINFAEECVRTSGGQYIRFDARGDYIQLIDFYKSLGYRAVGELPDEPCNYVLFEKELV